MMGWFNSLPEERKKEVKDAWKTFGIDGPMSEAFLRRWRFEYERRDKKLNLPPSAGLEHVDNWYSETDSIQNCNSYPYAYKKAMERKR